jgi:cytidine deaminase
MGAGYSGNTIHAERAVLKRIGDVTKLRGAELVVIRVGPRVDIKSSMPCSECKCHLEKCMRVYGLRYVYDA